MVADNKSIDKIDVVTYKIHYKNNEVYITDIYFLDTKTNNLLKCLTITIPQANQILMKFMDRVKMNRPEQAALIITNQ